ncbi:MAG: hypothetical protein R2743_03045 [Ilumatobacteraceae bacterium]
MRVWADEELDEELHEVVEDVVVEDVVVEDEVVEDEVLGGAAGRT